jgi:hypothetical protein
VGRQGQWRSEDRDTRALPPIETLRMGVDAISTHAQDPNGSQVIGWMRANDPSAGSPTETLLRLLLPLSDKVH